MAAIWETSVVSILALLAASFVRGPLTIHMATVDITPPERLPLGGYTERLGKLMQPGGDPLFARSLILERGPLKIAIVSAEMLTIPESLCREVRKRIPSDVVLFLAAVHTHCAPDSQMLNDRMKFAIPGIAAYAPLWLGWYAERIAESVNGALATPGFEVGKLSLKIGHIRLNRARRRGGRPDPASRELDAGRRVLFTEYAAHATIYGPEELHTRGDWPGAVATKTDAPVLVGAIGDVSPALDGPDPATRVQQFRDRLESSFRVAPRTVWKARDPISVTDQPILLEAPRPHPSFAKAYHAPLSLAKALVTQFAPSTASITAIRLGSLAIVGVPGEPTSALGSRISQAGRQLEFDNVIVCSHVNGWIGYILAPRDYDRGGYEATLSFNGRNESERVVQAATEAMRKLRN